MFTLFTIPKAFKGLIGAIQRNAVRSWQRLQPKCEILLFGDESGIAETADELGVIHVPTIEKNEYGTPLLSSAFDQAQRISSYDMLIYCNADIIFMQDLVVAKSLFSFERFLVCGRRRDLDVHDEIDFESDAWAEEMLTRLRQHSHLHGSSGIDYFVFPKLLVKMPPFAVGRPGWDNWLIHHMRSHGVPVIDATHAITAVHQNHGYGHSPFGGSVRVGGPEAKENIRLAGGRAKMMTLRDADWVLTRDGLRRPPVARRLISALSLFYPWQLLLAAKRRLCI